MKSFPTLHRSQVEIFVLNCFNTCGNPAAFTQHLRDFLVQIRQWGAQEDALYEAERQDALAKVRRRSSKKVAPNPDSVKEMQLLRNCKERKEKHLWIRFSGVTDTKNN
eukprot:2335109-Amphidinium_carterae.1